VAEFFFADLSKILPQKCLKKSLQEKIMCAAKLFRQQPNFSVDLAIITCQKLAALMALSAGQWLQKAREVETVGKIRALLPDGRIFGQITKKRPQIIIHGRKKLEPVKWQNLAKSGRTEAEKYLYLFK
jgi:hypothetical protein